jgi:hypothetical protein
MCISSSQVRSSLSCSCEAQFTPCHTPAQASANANWQRTSSNYGTAQKCLSRYTGPPLAEGHPPQTVRADTVRHIVLYALYRAGFRCLHVVTEDACAADVGIRRAGPEGALLPAAQLVGTCQPAGQLKS